MPSIPGITDSMNAAYASSSQMGAGQQLGQNDFLRLMIEQFRSQDPTKPMDNAQFLGQMAQFSQVQGLQQLQDSFGSLAQSLQSDQSLRAASLIGHKVIVESPEGTLDSDGTLLGAVDVPQGATAVTVEIKDSTGRVVKTLNVDAHPAGQTRFSWDGHATDGSTLPAGEYAISAKATVNGAAQAITTYATVNVQAVRLGATEPILDLGGLGQILLSQVFAII